MTALTESPPVPAEDHVALFEPCLMYPERRMRRYVPQVRRSTYVPPAGLDFPTPMG